MADTYLLARWCPVQSRRESDPGFRAELENLVGSAKLIFYTMMEEAVRFQWVAVLKTA